MGTRTYCLVVMSRAKTPRIDTVYLQLSRSHRLSAPPSRGSLTSLIKSSKLFISPFLGLLDSYITKSYIVSPIASRLRLSCPFYGLAPLENDIQEHNYFVAYRNHAS